MRSAGQIDCLRESDRVLGHVGDPQDHVQADVLGGRMLDSWEQYASGMLQICFYDLSGKMMAERIHSECQRKHLEQIPLVER